MPTSDDVLPESSEIKVFSTVDTKNGFYHLNLDEDSIYLTIFETPFGPFPLLALPIWNKLCTGSVSIMNTCSFSGFATRVLHINSGDSLAETECDDDANMNHC